MSRKEKLAIVLWVVFSIFVLTRIPLPVHKANPCCSSNECALQHHHERAVGEHLSPTQMKDFFDNLNREYYLGQLSKDVDIRWGDLTEQNWMAVTRNVNGLFVITIDRATHPTPNGIRMTIMHESCHIKTWNEDFDHGPKFQNCMVNLATHGAFEGIW